MGHLVLAEIFASTSVTIAAVSSASTEIIIPEGINYKEIGGLRIYRKFFTIPVNKKCRLLNPNRFVPLPYKGLNPLVSGFLFSFI